MFRYFKSSKLLVLVVLLIAGSIFASLRSDAVSKGRGFWLEDAVKVVITPLQSGVKAVGRVTGRLSQSVRSRGSLLRENKMLRHEVRRLSLENSRLREKAAESVRLKQSLGFKQSTPYELIPSHVIYNDPSNWFETCTIDRGRRSGVKIGSAVVTHRGLVGQVIYAGPTSSQVQMLTDQESRIAALVQRSRVQGLVIGQSSETLLMTYLTKDSDIQKGDIIVSSGAGKLVPKGLTIGRVMNIRREGVTKVAEVRPTVKPETVEDVFVIPATGS